MSLLEKVKSSFSSPEGVRPRGRTGGHVLNDNTSCEKKNEKSEFEGK